MNKILDWSPHLDSLLKSKEVEIHNALHLRKSKEAVTKDSLVYGRRLWRAEVIRKAPLVMGKSISGMVLDIGCGDGWSSALIADEFDATVYAMECDRSAVEGLIPKAFEAFGVPEDKYQLVLGSFNSIPCDNMFDVIVSMGAIHHSENLLKTLGECYKALKPGGWFIGSEPCRTNGTTNHQYNTHYDSSKNFWGVETIKEKDRSDHFFRLCEYETAAYHSGFNVYPFLFAGGDFSKESDGEEWDDTIFTNRECYDGFRKKILAPTMANCTPDQLFLTLEKPIKQEDIPHRWY